VTVYVDGRPTTTDSIGAADGFRGFDVYVKDSHTALTSLTVSPVR